MTFFLLICLILIHQFFHYNLIKKGLRNSRYYKDFKQYFCMFETYRRVGPDEIQIKIYFKVNDIPQARRQKFSEGGSFDTAGGLGAAQGSQKPLGTWCKILQSSNFQTLHSNFRKALFSITNF